MLRACRNALRPGGGVAFFTIVHDADADPARMLRSARFAAVEEHDVTPEYLRVARAWHTAWSRDERLLRAAIGDAAFDGEQSYRASSIAAVEAGTRKRALYTATRPAR